MGEAAARGRKRKTPPAVQVASGSLVVLWSAQQSRQLGIRWVGEQRHLIRGVNGPGDIAVASTFFFLIILWFVFVGSWEACATHSDSLVSDRWEWSRGAQRHFYLINYNVALEEMEKRVCRFLIG